MATIEQPAEMKQTQRPGAPSEVRALQFEDKRPDVSKLTEFAGKAYKDSITNWNYYLKNEWKKQSDEAVAQFGDNPAQLMGALEKIRTSMLPEDTPKQIRDSFLEDTYYDSASIMNKAQTNYNTRQRKETKANAGIYADGLTDDIATSYFNVLTYNTAPAEEKRPMDLEIYVKQRADLAKLADLTDDDGNFYFSETQRKNMKNPSDSKLEGFKRFFDGMLLNDGDDLKQSQDYYTKFMLAPERFMEENDMDRSTYDKARTYAEKELKRAGAEIKKARFNQSIKEAMQLQVEDLPEKIESLNEAGLIDKKIIKNIENTNVKFNKIDPSKAESPIAMLNLLQIVNQQKYNPAPTNEAEQQAVLEQGTAALDAVADYAQTYGLSPKNVQIIREAVVNQETDAAFRPILNNFSDIIDNFNSKLSTVRNISTGKGGISTAFKSLTGIDGMSNEEAMKLIKLNNVLAIATDTINQQIRTGDWDGVRQTQKDVQKQAARIKYDDFDWSSADNNPDAPVEYKGRKVKFKNYTLDGDVIFEIVE